MCLCIYKPIVWKEVIFMENKWVRGAIPALLLHCSIGTVYCWSTFSTEIANYIGSTKSATEWAFSLAIFFLGMSAAFLGNIVEHMVSAEIFMKMSNAYHARSTSFP